MPGFSSFCVGKRRLRFGLDLRLRHAAIVEAIFDPRSHVSWRPRSKRSPAQLPSRRSRAAEDRGDEAMDRRRRCPRSAPMRTTAPLSHGSSSGVPRSRSSSIDDFAFGGSPVTVAIISSNSSAGSVTPFGVCHRHRFAAPRPAASPAARDRSRIGPIGQRVTAVMPLKTERRTNFDQMSTSDVVAERRLKTGGRRTRRAAARAAASAFRRARRKSGDPSPCAG